MKLNHKTTLFIHLALANSFLFAGGVSTANQTNYTPLEQTDPNYGWESASEFYNEIPYTDEDDMGYSGAVTMSRDGETIYHFTNCGKTGRTGPSQAQANSSYSGTNLDGSVTVSGGIQSWTVPATGNYKIESVGAAGGTQLYQSDYPGGLGATMSGDFSLTQGTVLKIIVGQKGENTRVNNQDNAAPGGGGGSFVWISNSNPLIAAGGGGGGGRHGSGSVNAITSVNGNAAYGQNNGGSSGNGGRSNYGGSSYWAGGGSGWLSDGTGGNNSSNYNYSPGPRGAQGGRKPLNGGEGGVRWNDGNDEGGDGGFGGGGGGGSDNMGCGGGGGYSGGGGGNYSPSGNSRGGGAGSYNSGS
jgi:hypothetical protein